MFFFHRSPLERCFLYPGKNCDSPSMGAQNGPIDGPSMGHRWAMAKRSADHRWAIDGNAMVHRWPMDGLPWDPNSGRLKTEQEPFCETELFPDEICTVPKYAVFRKISPKSRNGPREKHWPTFYLNCIMELRIRSFQLKSRTFFQEKLTKSHYKIAFHFTKDG